MTTGGRAEAISEHRLQRQGKGAWGWLSPQALAVFTLWVDDKDRHFRMAYVGEEQHCGQGRRARASFTEDPDMVGLASTWCTDPTMPEPEQCGS